MMNVIRTQNIYSLSDLSILLDMYWLLFIMALRLFQFHDIKTTFNRKQEQSETA